VLGLSLIFFALEPLYSIRGGLNANSILRGSGFRWFEFLVFHPRTTIAKMARTIIEALTIIVLPSRSKLFRKFVKITKS